MKFTISIDQLTLEHWKGKIDTVDAFIIAFIDALDPKNPDIKKCMWRGHFLIKRTWLLSQIPLLQISEQTLYRRFKKLKALGIIEGIQRQIISTRKLAYFKLSNEFYDIRNKKGGGNYTSHLKQINYTSHLKQNHSSPMTSNNKNKKNNKRREESDGKTSSKTKQKTPRAPTPLSKETVKKKTRPHDARDILASLPPMCEKSLRRRLAAFKAEYGDKAHDEILNAYYGKKKDKLAFINTDLPPYLDAWQKDHRDEIWEGGKLVGFYQENRAVYYGGAAI